MMSMLRKNGCKSCTNIHIEDQICTIDLVFYELHSCELQEFKSKYKGHFDDFYDVTVNVEKKRRRRFKGAAEVL